jgi:predicted Zn-dependent peptidase
MLICVAGRVDPKEVELGLESFRGAPDGNGSLTPLKALAQTEPRFHFESYGSGSVDACLMVRTPGWESADSRLHTVLYLLTQYYQTHVYEELIGPKLPVYYLYAGQETFITEGYVYFYVNVSRNRFFPTLERVMGEIDRMRAEGIDPDELEVNKRRFVLSVLGNLDDPRDVAYRLGSDLLLCGRERALGIDEELEQIRTVTADEMQALVQELFQASHLCVVARGALGWWARRKLRKRLERWLP